MSFLLDRERGNHFKSPKARTTLKVSSVFHEYLNTGGGGEGDFRAKAPPFKCDYHAIRIRKSRVFFSALDAY